MSNELPHSVLKSIIWGDDMGLGEPDIDDEAPSPMEQFVHRAQVAAALEKSSGVSVVLDLPVPDADDADTDDGAYWKAPRVLRYQPDACAKASRASDERFARLTVMIQRIFGSEHAEEADEAVAICKRARDEERAAMIASL
jgi:hypothetical protein